MISYLLIIIPSILAILSSLPETNESNEKVWSEKDKIILLLTILVLPFALCNNYKTSKSSEETLRETKANWGDTKDSNREQLKFISQLLKNDSIQKSSNDSLKSELILTKDRFDLAQNRLLNVQKELIHLKNVEINEFERKEKQQQLNLIKGMLSELKNNKGIMLLFNDKMLDGFANLETFDPKRYSILLLNEGVKLNSDVNFKTKILAISKQLEVLNNQLDYIHNTTGEKRKDGIRYYKQSRNRLEPSFIQFEKILVKRMNQILENHPL